MTKVFVCPKGTSIAIYRNTSGSILAGLTFSHFDKTTKDIFAEDDELLENDAIVLPVIGTIYEERVSRECISMGLEYKRTKCAVYYDSFEDVYYTMIVVKK